jgi:hypothetical protein
MNQSQIPTEEILEALDLSRAEPGLGFLEALFRRFNARVPFETASKIVRAAQVTDPAERPRAPALFWKEHLELGAGGTCFERVAAFDAFLSALGFATCKVAGRVSADFDHAALLVEEKERLFLCDVGFPLPALLPAAPGTSDTALGEVERTRTELGLRVVLRGGVPEGPRELEIFEEPVGETRFLELWRKTFRLDSRFLASVSISLRPEGRVLSFSRGEARVDDLHSRLVVPLAAARAERLEEIFGMDRALIERAFALAGDPPPARRDATLTAYLETGASPEQAFAAIATPRSYAALLSGVGEVKLMEESPAGWRLRLAASGGAGEGSLEEEVACDRERLLLRIRRLSTEGAVFESSWRAERRGCRSFLLREAQLSGAREDLLRNDSLRGRLAATLAADLLAWTRVIR